ARDHEKHVLRGGTGRDLKDVEVLVAPRRHLGDRVRVDEGAAALEPRGGGDHHRRFLASRDEHVEVSVDARLAPGKQFSALPKRRGWIDTHGSRLLQDAVEREAKADRRWCGMGGL